MAKIENISSEPGLQLKHFSRETVPSIKLTITYTVDFFTVVEARNLIAIKASFTHFLFVFVHFR